MFGDRLKELREEKEFTQEELGKFLNVSRQTISGYESGAIEPSISNLVKIANIFNVSLDYLLCRTKERYNLNLENKKNKELLLDIIKVMEKYK
ncbi:XRE family transcriptional regulator [Clostridium botulinum]|uniref:helix-turn-helix domain-containing protein n=1 Tax=Clostridium botulinum TaxID=1491 RepID=UPI0001F84A0A|nr:helix-turn-helix transcriptional regulator [Clostridium botulinum]NFC96142.1 XRE family transcriptional regulator [Clostridium botulinum]NFD21134.1 XRE family transcriptional regulator [Clostridium botulinum]NFD27298.1 XRE family transcriptional regulator [Clostridium botulinum]NFD56139.1 XRE family transcriptional regulator [Clostridium botulinum]NFE89444.1 XRE family transcriptional regulator [Clostridium botulinum]